MSNGKIVVIGGNGFIGAQICRMAVETRHQVISLSQSGRRGGNGAWAKVVDWAQADIFEPANWRTYLRDADAVIDCVGIAFETPKKGLTFARMNGDSAILASQVAAEMKVGSFVFISAAPEAAVVLPYAYLDSKQRAEAAIQKAHAHWAVLRPGFVYGWGRPWTVLPGKALRFMTKLPLVKSQLEALRPLPVEIVASAALRAAIEPNLGGILDVPMIDRLGRSLLSHWQPTPVAKVA